MKEMWNNRYSEEGYAYGLIPNDFLVEQHYRIKKNGKVLCIAEGEGRNALFLARNGFQVTAVDYSEVGIRKIQERAFEENLDIETSTAHLEHFNMGSSKWDAIVSIFAHMPSSTRKLVHENIQKALVKEGILLLEAYTPAQLDFKTGGPKDSDMMMSLDSLHHELADLQPIVAQEIEREIHEGKYHYGRSSVVQYIGKK